MTEAKTLNAILKELKIMNLTLIAMKRQEYDYWEAWKKAKQNEG